MTAGSGDINQDGITDTSDILAMLIALTDVASYAQQKGLTVSQLQSIGDVNSDGKFNNADIQSLLDKVVGNGVGSGSSAGEPARASNQNESATSVTTSLLGVQSFETAVPSAAPVSATSPISESTDPQPPPASSLFSPDRIRSIDFFDRVEIESAGPAMLKFGSDNSAAANSQTAAPTNQAALNAANLATIGRVGETPFGEISPNDAKTDSAHETENSPDDWNPLQPPLVDAVLQFSAF